MDFSSIFKYINKAASSLNQRGNDQQNQQNQQNDEAKKALLVLQKLASRLAGPTLFTGLGIFIFIVIIVFFFFQDTDVGKALTGSSEDSPPSQEGGTNPTTPSVPSIPGLTIIVTAQESVQNGQDIEYKVEIRYDPATATTPIERIELYDTLPPGVVFAGTSGNKGINSTDKEITWPLSDPANSGGFTFTLHPYLEDIVVTNSVFARISPGAGSGTGSNACTAPYEGSGYCSVDSLAPIFGGDQTKSLIASMICQAESRSDPFALNTNCGTNDYSVGLFQINLIVYCTGAYANQDCNQLLDTSKRDVCEQSLKDPQTNIQKMFSISQGTYWKPWSTWPGVEAKLKACGIL